MAAGIDVVAVNYRSAAMVRTVCGRLAAGRGDRLGTVAVVDNDPGELEASQLAEAGRVELIRRSNDGFAGGVNAGWAIGGSPYVLLINPDAEVEWESVLRLAQALDSEPRLGAVAPLHLDHRGQVTNPYSEVPDWRDLLAHRFAPLRLLPSGARRLERYFATHLDGIGPDSGTVEVEQPPASCLLVRRQAVDGPPMDPRLPIYFNDVDLSRRLRDGGWRSAVVTAAVCRHEPGGAGGLLLGRALAAENQVGAYRYVRKWHGPLRALVYRAGVMAILALRAARHPGDGAIRRTIAALARNRSIFDAGNGDPVRAIEARNRER
jgi:GT2 family glycosyltransferase